MRGLNPDRHDAEEQAAADRPRFLPIIRDAVCVYRSNLSQIVLLTIMVFVPVAVVDGVLTHLIEETLPDHLSSGWLEVVVFGVKLVDLSASVVALTFFAGVIELLVEAHVEDRTTPSFQAMLRQLPWRRLLVADLLVWSVTSAGTALLVVPGFVVFTLLSIVGPLVVIEGIGPLSVLLVADLAAAAAIGSVVGVIQSCLARSFVAFDRRTSGSGRRSAAESSEDQSLRSRAMRNCPARSDGS